MASKKINNACEKAGFHYWWNKKDGINFDSRVDDMEELCGRIVCHECGATAYMTGFWEAAEEED